MPCVIAAFVAAPSRSIVMSDSAKPYSSVSAPATAWTSLTQPRRFAPGIAYSLTPMSSARLDMVDSFDPGRAVGATAPANQCSPEGLLIQPVQEERLGRSTGSAGSGGDRDLVDLVRRVTGALVDAPHGVGARSLGQAEHMAARGVGPGVLEHDALVVLDVEVGLVGLHQCFRCHTRHVGVNVHELWHVIASLGRRSPDERWLHATPGRAR